MRRRPLLIALVPAFLLLLLAGCAQTRRSDALTDTLSAYRSALRWGSFAQAEQFVDPAYRKAHPLTDLDKARYNQVRVSDYNDDAAPVPVSKTEVRQTVQIGLINRNTQAERTIVDHQVWKYDADKHHWWLESGLPDITQGR